MSSISELFDTPEQESLFLEVSRKVSSRIKVDILQEASLSYLLAGNEELLQKVLPYLEQNKFDYEAMFKEQNFTPEIELLAKLAVLIYNGEEDFKFSDLYRTLNGDNLKLANMTALIFFASEVSEEKVSGDYRPRDTNSYI